MTTPSIVKAGNDPVQTEPQRVPETKITFDTGVVESDSTLLTDKVEYLPRISQKMPSNTLTDYLTRFTEIGSFTFSGTTNFGVPIATLDVWSLFLNNSFIASKVSNFSLIRGTLEILVISAFPGNAHGLFSVTAYPTAADEPTTSTSLFQPNYPTCIQTDRHALVNVSSAENVTLSLPWLWPYDYAMRATLQAADPNTQHPWYVVLWSLAPVGTSIPGGVSTGTIQVYARLTEDYQLCVPVLQGKNRGAHAGASALASKIPGADKYKGKISGMADAITSVTSKMAGIPIIGPYASVATGIIDTVGDVASWFGFTREDKEEQPTSVNARPFSNPAHIDSMDTSDTTSLSLTNALSIDPRINGVTSAEDVCAYEKLFARWTLLSATTWAPGQAAGTQLYTFYVTPFLGNGVSTTTNTNVSLPVAGFVGLPFNYWRGDMEYMVIIPVSKLHRGTLQIYWVPFGSTTTASPTNSTLNMIYDVAADDVKMFSVGYARDQPYLRRVVMGTGDFTFVIAPQGYTNGQLVLRVVNPLQSQNPADSVTVFVFARGGQNMDFQMPADSISVVNRTGLIDMPMQTASFLYQGADGDEDGDEPEMMTLVPTSGEYPAEEINFGETIRSVRPLLQKFCYIGDHFQKIGAASNFMSFPHTWTNVASAVNFNYSRHYSLMFHGVAGSMRYKLLANTTNLFAAAFPLLPSLTTPFQANTAEIPPLTSYQTLSYGGAEFKIPYYNNRKFCCTMSVYTNPLKAPQTDAFYFGELDGTTDLIPRVLNAWGPDFRPTMFGYLPNISLTLVASTGPF